MEKSSMITAVEIQKTLGQYADAKKAEAVARYFKTGKGEYGEGDVFLGINVPTVRLVAKQYHEATLDVVKELLQSEFHECRACALFLLVEMFKKAHKNDVLQKEIFDFYLSQTHRINNWDLVDASAPYIVGKYVLNRPRDILYRLLESPLLWENRIAIVANLCLIKAKDFNETFCLIERLMAKAPKIHDLMQKASGWMLREIHRNDGKNELCDFLERHAATMPRTMLRYAIEKMDTRERAYYMTKRSSTSAK